MYIFEVIVTLIHSRPHIQQTLLEIVSGGSCSGRCKSGITTI